MGRFAYALAICMKSGVPWGRGMQVVSQAVDNNHLSRKVHTMREGVEHGETIPQPSLVTVLSAKVSSAAKALPSPPRPLACSRPWCCK